MHDGAKLRPAADDTTSGDSPAFGVTGLKTWEAALTEREISPPCRRPER